LTGRVSIVYLPSSPFTFVVSQADGTATDPETIITNAVITATLTTTDKVCREESGICNAVKTQLQSKFFTDTTTSNSNPSDLRVEGVAILAFEQASFTPSSATHPRGTVGTPAIRRLRAPIHGLVYSPSTSNDVKAFMLAAQQAGSS
jgi:hypothetical protein